MKSTQKIPLIFILAICLILSCIPAFADDANTVGFDTLDSTPPVLHDLSVNKTTVTVPGYATFTINATDDISGIRTIRMSVYGPNEDEFKSMQMGGAGDEYFRNIIFSKGVDLGKYYIRCISLEDRYRNSVNYYSSKVPDTELLFNDLRLPKEIEINVTNSSSDVNPTPPVTRPSSSSSSSGGGGSGRGHSSSNSKTSTPLLKSKNSAVALTNPKTSSATPAQAPASVSYGTVDIDRGAHDLVMLYMGSLNLSEDEYAEYYINNYEALYKKFYDQLATLSK